MTVTREDLRGWLASGWSLNRQRVQRSDWSRPAWKAQWLCQRALQSKHYLHHETTSDDPTQVVVWFARNTAG